MAEISLKEYHDKLEALLKANQVDEAIHHCRHILQYYPLNAATYRFLGRALLAGGSLTEAAEVFRRVLSVYPDDITAHSSLAAIYRQTGNDDDAIWHLERVYEQDTANAGYQQSLRELYRQHRGIDQPRLQLTTGAVARQYLAGGRQDEAIKTLHEALAAAPQRTDLRLLLARALWDSGQSVESAEAALDTLETLPDCLEANHIMARFWLDEKRPSDAQRYVGRIEALDPYLAYRIAQNTPAPDGAFTLLELDYGRVVKRRLATETPDWLGDLDPASGDVSSAAAPAHAAAADDLPDWLTEDSGLDAAFSAGDQPQAADISFDFDAEDFPTFEADTPSDRPHTGFTGMLAALEQPDAPEAGVSDEAADDLGDDELPDWLLESAPAAAPDAEAAPPISALDADWIREPVADADMPEPAALAPEPPPPNPDDALAWLYGSGIELADEDAAAAPLTADDDDDMTYTDPGAVDPLAWLYDSGIELNAEADTDAAPASAAADAAPLAGPDEAGGTFDVAPLAVSAARPADEDDDDAALDWLSDDSLLDEMLDLEALAASPEASPPDVPIGWAGMTDVLPGTPHAAAEQPEVNPVLDHESEWQTEMPDNDQQLPDWLQPEDDEPETPEDAFSWLNDQPPAEAANEEGASGADDLSAAGPPAWLAAALPGEADDQFEWLAEAADEPESAAPEAATPDWLVGAAQTAPLRADALDNVDSAALGEWPGSAEDEPEWLTELAGGAEAETPTAPEAEAASDFEWASGEGDAVAMPDWLTGVDEQPSLPLAGETEDDADIIAWPEQSEDEPEWLTQLAGSTAAQPEAAPEPEAEAASFEWIADMDDEAEVEPAAEMPDWLSEVAPLTDSGFAAEFETEDDEAEVEPAAEMPDWLSEAAPLAAVGFAAEFETEDEEAEAEPAAEMPDWLSEAAPVIDSSPAEAEAFAWDAEPEVEPQTDFIAFELEPADTAKLGELPEADDAQPWAEGAAEAVPLAERGPAAWEIDDEEAPAADDGDWAEKIGPAAAAAVAASALTEPDYSFEPARSEFGWLEDVSSAAPSADVEEALLAGESFTPAQTSADDEMDWLAAEAEAEGEAAAAALLDDEEPFVPPSVSARAESAWAEIESEEEEAEAALFGDEPPYAPAEVSAGDDWYDEAGDEDAAEQERMYAAAHRPPPADNAPEWLNNMVPGLELDYQAQEDEPLESAFVEQPGAAAAAGRDFDWLNRIVDEETGPVLAVSAAAAAGAAVSGPRQPRFVFTRQPAWLRRGPARREADEADTPDSGDDDDFELPDWLR